MRQARASLSEYHSLYDTDRLAACPGLPAPRPVGSRGGDHANGEV